MVLPVQHVGHLLGLDKIYQHITHDRNCTVSYFSILPQRYNTKNLIRLARNTGSQHWLARLATLARKTGSQDWLARLARKTGSQDWLARLARKTGSHWLARLARKTGSQDWLARLARKTGSQLARNTRSCRVFVSMEYHVSLVHCGHFFSG